MKNIFKTSLVIACLLLTSYIATAQVISGTYAIKNVQTGMLLRIKDANSKNGTPIVSYNPVEWKCMTWDFQYKEGNTYQLLNLFSNKTLQPMQKAAESVEMEEQPLVAGDAGQQYEFIPAGKNIYNIRLKGTDLYISPVDEKGTVNSAIVLTSKHDAKLQQWTIYEQHPDF